MYIHLPGIAYLPAKVHRSWKKMPKIIKEDSCFLFSITIVIIIDVFILRDYVSVCIIVVLKSLKYNRLTVG